MNNYIQADQQLHRLSQIMAKVNRSFVKPKDDDSHTNLGFKPTNDSIESRWIESEKGKIKLALRLTDVCFVWLDEDRNIIQTVSTAKKEVGEIEDQISKTLNEFGFNVEEFKKPMHYQIPEYSFYGQPVALLSRLALNEWVHWRSLAIIACEYILRTFKKQGEIRIWPHHFDTGIYMDLNEKLGIGFGFAMKDDHVGTPYYYVTCYPKKGEADYSGISELTYGRWVVDDWHGAVLSLKEIENTNRKVSKTVIQKFIDETLEWYDAL